MKTLFFSVFCFFSVVALKAQQTNTLLFNNGIPLKNPDVTIPWGITFQEIHKYGSPKTICNTNTNTKVIWSEVLIFDSIPVTLSTNYLSCYTKKQPKGKLNTFYGQIDSTRIEQVRIILESFTGINGKLVTAKSAWRYTWVFDNCYVHIGYNKRDQTAFLNIQLQNHTHWK